MRLIFYNPTFLWLLLVIPFLIILHFVTLKYIKKTGLKFSNFEAIARVTRGYKIGRAYKGLLSNRNISMLLIRGLTLLLIISALADPTVVYTGPSSGFDFVLAIDTSSSMLAKDISPTRLEAAKDAAKIFVENVPSEVGLVSFSGSALANNELTKNVARIKQQIDTLEATTGGGTDIGGALVSSANLMIGENRSKVIILLTDGNSNVGIAVDDAIKYVLDKQIVVHTIGIGTDSGTYNDELKFSLDEETLNEISSKTGGQNFRAKSVDELTKAYQEISNIEEAELTFELSFTLIILALFFSMLEWVLLNTKYKVIT